MWTGEPTPMLKLPQFEPGNHPDFLTDFNKAFQKIDTNASQTIDIINKMLVRIRTLELELKQTRIDAGLTNVKESEVTHNE